MKRKMKKLAALLGAAALVLTACGNTQPQADGTENTVQETNQEATQEGDGTPVGEQVRFVFAEHGIYNLPGEEGNQLSYPAAKPTDHTLTCPVSYHQWYGSGAFNLQTRNNCRMRLRAYSVRGNSCLIPET